MEFGIDGNTALCTAASSGLGFASALALAEEGADIAICGRTETHLDEARAQLEDAGDGEVLAVEADITEQDHVSAFVEQTADELGGIDHVVTSAGGPPSGPFVDIADADWYDAYDLLVMSAVWTLRETYPYLEASEAGTAVAITSRSVREVIDDLVLSNSVRRAVIGLVKTLSREFAPDVRLNAVLPGAHETARIENLIDAAVERGEFDSYDEGYQEWAADIPLDRVGEPRELGDVVAFLSSDRASFVTGTAVPVDGGSMRS